MRSIQPLTALALGLILCGSLAAQTVEIPYQAKPLENVTTAGQPDAAALQSLAETGVTTVIDLRGVAEDRGFNEQSVVEAAGMTYIALPVEGASGITYENAAALDRILADIDGPVLLHCSTSNRVGALLALREKLNGADDERALELGREAGLTRLEPVVRERLEASAPAGTQ